MIRCFRLFRVQTDFWTLSSPGFPHGPKQRADRIVRRAKAGETRKFHIRETRFLEQSDLIPDRDRTPDSLRPGFKAACHACRKFIFQNDIGELKPTSALQDAMDLLEAGLLVGR